MELTDEEKYVRDYADGIFRGLHYHLMQIELLGEKLDYLNWQLSGEPSSPKIRSLEEAKYQRGTYIYKNRLIELMDEEDEVRKQYNISVNYYHRISSFLQTLTVSEVNLLTEYYEYRRNKLDIALDYYCSKDTIRRELDRILLKFGGYSEN